MNAMCLLGDVASTIMLRCINMMCPLGTTTVCTPDVRTFHFIILRTLKFEKNKKKNKKKTTF